MYPGKGGIPRWADRWEGAAGTLAKYPSLLALWDDWEFGDDDLQMCLDGFQSALKTAPFLIRMAQILFTAKPMKSSQQSKMLLKSMRSALELACW